MFRRVDEKAKPAPKDESIRKEAQLEGDLQSLGNAGNEEANIWFFEMLLDKGNVYDSSNRKKQPIEKKKSCSSTLYITIRSEIKTAALETSASIPDKTSKITIFPSTT